MIEVRSLVISGREVGLTIIGVTMKLLETFPFLHTKDGKLDIGELPDNSTVLSRFIYEKILNHPQPERKGIARGRLIGMGKRKFLISLLMALTNFSTREISEALNTNYFMLRGWTLSPEFSKLVEQHRKDFVSVWLQGFMEDQEEPLVSLDGKLRDLEIYHPKSLDCIHQQLIYERDRYVRRA